MIPVTLHLLACIALVAASIYWRIHAPESDSIYRDLLPYTISAGFLGLVILYGYLMELFVAFYSGVRYDDGGGAPTRGQLAWIGVSVLLSLLPLAGIFPSIGRHLHLLMIIGGLAAVPGIVSLIAQVSDRQAGP